MEPFSHRGRGVGRRGGSFGGLRGSIWRIHGGFLCRVWMGLDVAAVSGSGCGLQKVGRLRG
jgi:hypothetical protein